MTENRHIYLTMNNQHVIYSTQQNIHVVGDIGQFQIKTIQRVFFFFKKNLEFQKEIRNLTGIPNKILVKYIPVNSDIFNRK